jgi:hypothetical protein
MRSVSHPIPSLTLHFVERRIRASLQRTQFEVPDPLRLARLLSRGFVVRA